MTDTVGKIEFGPVSSWPTIHLDLVERRYYEQVEAERDEAREIARELAEFLRHVLHTGWLRPWWDMEYKHAWRRIRPGVRRWLEE